MNINFSNKIWPILSSLLAAVLLFAVIFWGFNTGKNLAASETVLANSSSLKQSLDFFYSDQGRYPTALEFKDPNVMLNYLNVFPPQDIAGGGCSESFAYKRSSPGTFELSFCLPAGSGGFSKGWNKVSGGKN